MIYARASRDYLEEITMMYIESSISVKNTNECLDPQFQIYPTQAYTQTIDVRNNRYKQKSKQIKNSTP